MEISKGLQLAALCTGLFVSINNPVQAESHSKIFNLYLGIGAHSENFDCHQPAVKTCFSGDDLAIVEFTVKSSEHTAAKLVHISNYSTGRDRGLNAVFFGLDYSF